MSVAQKSSKIKTPPSNMHSRVHWWAVICEWKILLSVLFCFWYFSFHWELSFYTICIFLNIKSFWILPQMNPIEQNFHRGSVQLAKKRGGTVLHLGTSHPWVIVQGGSLKFLGVEALFYDIFRIIVLSCRVWNETYNSFFQCKWNVVFDVYRVKTGCIRDTDESWSVCSVPWVIPLLAR